MCFIHQDQVVQFLFMQISYQGTVLLLLMNMGWEKYEEEMIVWTYEKRHLMVLFNGLLNRCYCCLFQKVEDFEIDVTSSFQATCLQFQNCLAMLSINELYKEISHLHNHKILCSSLFRHGLITE